MKTSLLLSCLAGMGCNWNDRVQVGEIESGTFQLAVDSDLDGDGFSDASSPASPDDVVRVDVSFVDRAVLDTGVCAPFKGHPKVTVDELELEQTVSGAAIGPDLLYGGIACDGWPTWTFEGPGFYDASKTTSTVTLSDGKDEVTILIPNLRVPPTVARVGEGPVAPGDAVTLELSSPPDEYVTLLHASGSPTATLCSDPAVGCDSDDVFVEGNRLSFTMPDVCIDGTWDVWLGSPPLEPQLPENFAAGWVYVDQYWESTLQVTFPEGYEDPVCPVHVYDIQEAGMAPGQRVRIVDEDVVVTTPDAGGGFYVKVENGVWPGSGLFVTYDEGTFAPEVQAGRYVSLLQGTYEEEGGRSQLRLDSVADFTLADGVTPYGIEHGLMGVTEDFGDAALLEPFEGTLIGDEARTVVACCDGSGRYTLDDGVIVDDFFVSPEETGIATGVKIERLDGIVHVEDGQFFLAPRWSQDVRLQ